MILLLIVFCALLNAQDTIIFVAPYNPDNPYGPENREVKNIRFLERHGFNVQMFWPHSGLIADAGQDTIDILNAADLIIIGPSSPSAAFGGDSKTVWNSLTAPVMCICPWTARSNRLNLFNSAKIHAAWQYDMSTWVKVTDPGDSLYRYADLQEDSLQWFNPPHDCIVLDSASNAEILVAYQDSMPQVARFAPGVPFYDGTTDAPAGSRTYFGMGSEVAGTNNFFPLTKDAQAVYLAEICRMMGQEVRELIWLTPQDIHIIFVTDDNLEREHISFLERQGFNVTKFWPENNYITGEGQETIDMLNAADLVIIGRSGPSDAFQNENKPVWNGLTVPVMCICPWKARNIRLNMFNSDQSVHYNEDPPVAVADVIHPMDEVFSGIPMEGNMLDWFAKPPHDFIQLAEPTNGTIMATFQGEHPLFARFNPGVQYYEGAGDAPAGPRTYFGMGNDKITGNVNFFPLTNYSKKVYLAELCRMVDIDSPQIKYGPAGYQITFVTPNEDEADNIQLLERQGFNVRTFWPAEDRISTEPSETIEWLEESDLIIIGRSCGSGNFRDFVDRAIWHGMETPQMILSPWTARSTRMKLFNSTDVLRHEMDILTVYARISDTNDIVISQVDLEGDSLPWINPPNDYLVLNSPSNGSILASCNGKDPLFARFEANVPFYDAPDADIPAGPRTYFGMGNDNATGVPEYLPLTRDGKMVYINEICRILGIQNFIPWIPEGEDVYGRWTLENSPYYIDKNLTIPDDSTLTIDPGVHVIFRGYYFLLVHGTLIAEGTESDNILFTVEDSTDFGDMNSELGGWQGIFIENFGQMDNNDTTVLKHCIIEYAKGTSLSLRFNGGALNIDNTGRVRIENSIIRNNSSIAGGGGIALESRANVLIRNCIIHDNIALRGGGLRTAGSSFALIERNLICRNTSVLEGGGIRPLESQSLFVNNIIANNYAGSGGGIDAAHSFDRYLGNLIINNESDHSGGGMNIGRCSPDIINNTICNNKANNGVGGGIHMWSTGKPNIVNTILWGNSGPDTAQLNIGNLAIPDIYNCIIEGGMEGISMMPEHKYYGVYENNLDQDPLFKMPSDSAGMDFDGLITDWSVQIASPSLNKGDNNLADDLLNMGDVYGNPRLQYAIIDIGAVETSIDSLGVGGEITSDTSWVADTVFVWDDIIIRDSATLTISPGTVVEFQGYYGIINEGVLNAVGAPGQMIKFTIHDPAGHEDFESTNGSWKGIVINNWDHGEGASGAMSDNDTTRLEYCILEYANNWNRSDHDRWGGALQILNYSKVVVANSIIRNNIAAEGAGIYVAAFAGPLIKNNLIYSNWSINHGGGILVWLNSWPLIANNVIANNYSGDFVGGISVIQAFPTIVNNVVCNNLANNVGGVNFYQSDPVFANNAVVNNQAIYFLGGMEITNCSPEIINSIFWGNEDNSGNHQVAANDLPIFYHCVVERLNDGGFHSQGPVYNMLDADPEFTLPSAGAGTDHSGLDADWSISDFSPLINAGLNQSPELFPGSADITGFPRVNADTVDIGPYENRAGRLNIIQHPVNQTICEGQKVVFSVKADRPARYRWWKDEKSIEGADSSVLVFDPVSTDHAGNYSCEVSNGYGPVNSHNVRLEVKLPPEILLQSESQWMVEDASLKLEVISAGSDPIKYQWYMDGDTIPGKKLPQLKLDSIDITDEGEYTCRVRNVCGTVYTEPITLYMAPQICMVTIDTSSGDNLVVWEKQSTAPIALYNIYRESIAAGEYEKIGEVAAGDLTVFADTGADPTSQAYIYKISALTEDGRESDLSRAHMTIHLVTSLNTEFNVANLVWEEYYGFKYGTYYILRSTSQTGFSLYQPISSSFTSFTDRQAIAGKEYWYRVAVEKPGGCHPGGNVKKVGTGPYNHSLSNMDDNKLKEVSTGKLEAGQELSIFPNPVVDRAIIEFRNPDHQRYQLFIRDLSGKILYMEDHVYGKRIEISRESIPGGLYLIELKGPVNMRSKIVFR